MILKQINFITTKPFTVADFEKINKLIEVTDVHINGNIVIKKIRKEVTFDEMAELKFALSTVVNIPVNKILFTYEER